MLLFHLIIVCSCIVLQTSILGQLPWLGGFYDPLLAVTIYFGLFGKLRGSLPVILLAGFLNDNLSGAPFGAFTLTYIWLFIAVRTAIRYLQAVNVWLWIFAVASGVILENLFFLSCQALLVSEGPTLAAAGRRTGVQLVWAMLTGPWLLKAFVWLEQTWQSWHRHLSDSTHFP